MGNYIKRAASLRIAETEFQSKNLADINQCTADQRIIPSVMLTQIKRDDK